MSTVPCKFPLALTEESDIILKLHPLRGPYIAYVCAQQGWIDPVAVYTSESTWPFDPYLRKFVSHVKMNMNLYVPEG